MIHLILILLFLLIFVIFSLIALPVEFLIGKCNPRLKQVSSQKIVKAAFNILLFLGGTRRTVIGKDRIPKDQPVLFASNHRSYFDIVILGAVVNGTTGFIAKKEIAKVPILKQWMENIRCLFLDREDPRAGLKTILAGIEQIKEGTSMYIAPEGTRNQQKEMLEFKPGSLKVAEKSGCPIVPVAISHADDIFEQHIPFVHSTHVTIEFGEPIFVSGLDAASKKILMETVKEDIRVMLAKND